jgi:hypothetical protein
MGEFEKEEFLKHYDEHREELDGYTTNKLNKMLQIKGYHIGRSKKEGLYLKPLNGRGNKLVLIWEKLCEIERQISALNDDDE